MKDRNRKKLTVQQEVERRLKEIKGNGEPGFFWAFAERRVIARQASERYDLIERECRLVERDARRSILAQMGASASASSSASDD
jgi:hypothetical protein